MPWSDSLVQSARLCGNQSRCGRQGVFYDADCTIPCSAMLTPNELANNSVLHLILLQLLM